MTKFDYISDEEGLKGVVRLLGGARAVAVDLEADSMFHYREKVCLIQMALNNHRWAIDPLMIKDISSLAPIFANQSIEKIFHGADYDIRSLYRDFGIEINNLFDTELACRYLGASQTGLANVLAARFNVQVDKKYQKKDWSRRPLPQEMLDYAMGDVDYLVALAGMLKKELRGVGRYDWVKEECRLLTQVRPPIPDPQPFYLKFSGAGKLDRRSLAVLEALLVVRDEMAQKKDRPVFKIIGNRSIHRIVLAKPTHVSALKQSGALSEKQMAMYAPEILTAVNKALSLSPQDLPSYPRHNNSPPDFNLARRIKALKAWREKKARFLDMPPGLVINNTQIAAIASLPVADRVGLMAVDGMRTWQVDLLGDDLLGLLNGVTTHSRTHFKKVE